MLIWQAILGLPAGGFIGIGIGSYAVIESAITISRFFGISEYLISFFLVSLGTSLPELVVEVAVVGVLIWRGVNDKQTGAFFILLYLSSYLIPYFL